MAVIQSYNDSVTAQGQMNTQANPNDFGAQVGSAAQNFGGAIADYATAVHENEVRDDVTAVHVEMAKKRADWQQKLADMANSTQPGDQTLAPRVMQDMQAEFETMGQNVKTRAGQQTFAKMSADMTSMFGAEAIGLQSRLNGEFAKNQYTQMSGDLGRTAAQDHTQVESLIKQGQATIDDPNGRFAKLPESTREAFKKSIKEEIEFDAAKGFARKYPNAVLGTVPAELRSKVQDAIANPPTPGLPPDLKADTVKPYTQSTIDSRAKLVAQASPFDKTFQAAAQLYNLDWRELKMRAVAESGLDPKALSSQNAGGIMQMTPETAKQLGVDRNDPVASIMGAAKLIADYRTKANGDMAKVDMMYYGGESGTAWGPNTKQYAANLAALREGVGLGSGTSPEAFAPSATTQAADSQNGVKSKTGIGFIDNLPADKFFSILTEAEHYQRAYDSQSERTRIEENHRNAKAQEATMDGFFQRIVNPTQENGGAVNEIAIVSNPILTSQQKQHLIDTMGQRSRELQSRMEPKSNPVAVRELMLRIHAPDEDKSRIYNNEPIYDALKNGKISTAEFKVLDNEVRSLKDSSTNGFQKDVNNARNMVFRTLQQNTQLQAMEMAAPGTIADMAYRFDRDMEKQIDFLRKQNKDPRVLLDPESRDYLLRPGRIQSFMPGNSPLSTGAANVAQSQVAQLPTYKDYDTLAKGATYTDPQGNVRTKK